MLHLIIYHWTEGHTSSQHLRCIPYLSQYRSTYIPICMLPVDPLAVLRACSTSLLQKSHHTGNICMLRALPLLQAATAIVLRAPACWGGSSYRCCQFPRLLVMMRHTQFPKSAASSFFSTRQEGPEETAAAAAAAAAAASSPA